MWGGHCWQVYEIKPDDPWIDRTKIDPTNETILRNGELKLDHSNNNHHRNNKRAYAGQLNSLTHLRALLVLHMTAA
jgi:hypothetical protein